MELPATSYAKENQRQTILSTIALAFSADPLMRWLLPSAGDYYKHFTALSDAYGGASINEQSCLINEDIGGAAMWLAPNIHPDAEKLVGLMQSVLSEEKLTIMLTILEQMQVYHPVAENCWYLAMIGVDPGHQGRGLGSLLMRDMLKRLDDLECQAYLESSNPQNIPFYQRYGFNIIGEIQIADSPLVIPMLREAQ